MEMSKQKMSTGKMFVNVLPLLPCKDYWLIALYFTIMAS